MIVRAPKSVVPHRSPSAWVGGVLRGELGPAPNVSPPPPPTCCAVHCTNPVLCKFEKNKSALSLPRSLMYRQRYWQGCVWAKKLIPVPLRSLMCAPDKTLSLSLSLALSLSTAVEEKTVQQNTRQHRTVLQHMIFQKTVLLTVHQKVRRMYWAMQSEHTNRNLGPQRHWVASPAGDTDQLKTADQKGSQRHIFVGGQKRFVVSICKGSTQKHEFSHLLIEGSGQFVAPSNCELWTVCSCGNWKLFGHSGPAKGVRLSAPLLL